MRMISANSVERKEENVPYKSKKQQGYFHAHEDEIGKDTVREFDKSSKGKKLPKRVGPKKPKRRR